jgi:hypothetical protein
MQAGEHQMGMLGWTDNGDPDNFTLLAKTPGFHRFQRGCFVTKPV